MTGEAGKIVPLLRPIGSK